MQIERDGDMQIQFYHGLAILAYALFDCRCGLNLMHAT